MKNKNIRTPSEYVNLEKTLPEHFVNELKDLSVSYSLTGCSTIPSRCLAHSDNSLALKLPKVKVLNPISACSVRIFFSAALFHVIGSAAANQIGRFRSKAKKSRRYAV